MKKYRLFITALFCLAWIIPSHAQTEWQVVSPITCTRAAGEPVTASFLFSALGGTATLEITNGSLTDDDIEKVSSSTFILNGDPVCGPNDFNQNVDSIVKEITLLNSFLHISHEETCSRMSFLSWDTKSPSARPNISSLLTCAIEHAFCHTAVHTKRGKAEIILPL